MFFRKRRVDTESPYADPRNLEILLKDGEPVVVVDVRTEEEYEAGHIPGAMLIPHREIHRRPPTGDTDSVVVVYCTAGVRSAKAKNRLIAAGFAQTVNFGGIDRWLGALEYGSQEAGI